MAEMKTAGSTGSKASVPPAAVSGTAWLMLAMATLGFAVNFWAWALISPLGPLFRDTGTLGHADRVRRRPAGRGPGASSARWAGSSSARSPTATAAG